MKLPNFVLQRGESLGETNVVDNPDDDVFYTYTEVRKAGRSPLDVVILDITKSTDKIVLVDGNRLQLKVLGGIGVQYLRDLATGEFTHRLIDKGDEFTVPIGHISWYKNFSGENLLVRDTCEGFMPEHEVSIADFSEAVSRLLFWPKTETGD